MAGENPLEQGEGPGDQTSDRPAVVGGETSLRARLQADAAKPITAVLAIAYGGEPPNDSHASPHRVVAINGKTYWIKAVAQGGLEVELVAGRLAHALSVGPLAEVVDVPTQALPADGRLARLQGRMVGSIDHRDTVNARYLDGLVADGTLDVSVIDVGSRASVIAFQTWIGASDEQVLVNLKTGRILSIDHGDCLPDGGQLMRVVVAPIPGLSADIGRDFSLLRNTLTKILQVTEDDLIAAVSGIPDGNGWNGSVERRFRIVDGLLDRQSRLEEVLRAWAPPLP
jgi:hypothetical protein